MPDETAVRREGEVEIDLYQWLLAVRRQWSLIILIVVVVVVGTGLASLFVLPKIFEVTGAMRLGRMGQRRPLAGRGDVVQLVKGGSFTERIIAELKLDEKKWARRISRKIDASVAPEGEVVRISFETKEPDVGCQIIEALMKHICATYDPRAEALQAETDAQIKKAEEHLKVLEARKTKFDADIKVNEREIERLRKTLEINVEIKKGWQKNAQAQIERTKARIELIRGIKDKLTAFVGVLDENMRELLANKQQSTWSMTENEFLSYMLFANNLQQGIDLVNRGYDRIKEYEVDIVNAEDRVDQLTTDVARTEQEIQELTENCDAQVKKLEQDSAKLVIVRDQDIPGEIEKNRQEISRLKAIREQIETIEVVMPPNYLKERPVRPRVGYNVAVAGGLALIAGCLLAVIRDTKRRRGDRAREESAGGATAAS